MKKEEEEEEEEEEEKSQLAVPPIEKPKNAEPGTDDIPFDDPFDLPLWRKWLITVMLSLVTLTATFSSSIFSATIQVTAKHFDVSETVMLLGVSLYVLGFAAGPIVWGPLSEAYGRKLPIFTGLALFAVFQIPIGTVDSLAGILICRFLTGCFGSAPVALVSAIYSDFWPPAERGTAAAVYGLGVYCGPTLGPIVGSFATYSSVGWRWTAWLPLIMAGFFGTIAFITTPETYAPVLKRRAAKKLGRPGPDKVVLREFVSKYVVRPAKMLAVEPLLDAITLYISVVYGLLYLSFFAIPYTYQKKGWKPTVSSLPFLSLLLGVVFGSFCLHLYMRKYYAPRLKRRKGKVLPEDRLIPIMVGGIVLPIGLFWFAWTASNHIDWVANVIPIFFIGFGIMAIFSVGIQYVIDVYLPFAASASSANCIVRSAVAAGLPLAAPRMYDDLGIAWATSVLAFICCAMIPFPFLFWKYGEKIRQNSQFSPT